MSCCLVIVLYQLPSLSVHVYVHVCIFFMFTCTCMLVVYLNVCLDVHVLHYVNLN